MADFAAFYQREKLVRLLLLRASYGTHHRYPDVGAHLTVRASVADLSPLSEEK